MIPAMYDKKRSETMDCISEASLKWQGKLSELAARSGRYKVKNSLPLEEKRFGLNYHG